MFECLNFLKVSVLIKIYIGEANSGCPARPASGRLGTDAPGLAWPGGAGWPSQSGRPGNSSRVIINTKF